LHRKYDYGADLLEMLSISVTCSNKLSIKISGTELTASEIIKKRKTTATVMTKTTIVKIIPEAPPLFYFHNKVHVIK
jgi:hypothetical protein